MADEDDVKSQELTAEELDQIAGGALCNNEVLPGIVKPGGSLPAGQQNSLVLGKGPVPS